MEFGSIFLSVNSTFGLLLFAHECHNELGAIVDVVFVEESRNVAFGGRFGNTELCGDFGITFALKEQVKDVFLTRRKLFAALGRGDGMSGSLGLRCLVCCGVWFAALLGSLA